MEVKIASFKIPEIKTLENKTQPVCILLGLLLFYMTPGKFIPAKSCVISGDCRYPTTQSTVHVSPGRLRLCPMMSLHKIKVNDFYVVLFK